MSKLIVLSNRVSLPQPNAVQNGGLAVALNDALQGIGGVWMGWDGKQQLEKTDHFESLKHAQVEYQTCALSKAEYTGYYCRFANSALWPLMHEQKKRIDYKTTDYQVYQAVNLKFAQQLQKTAQPEDIIWVHDYHFLSVAYYCRQLGMKNRIGFFLHIPFPKPKQWKALAEHRELAFHLAHYDVVGLQTEYDQHHCLEFIQQTLSLNLIDAQHLQFQGKILHINCYPIGVLPDAIQQRAALASQNPQHSTDIQSISQRIISVDRIDYSKGLLEKMEAFSALLERYPHLRQQIQYQQIATPCRLEVPAYRNLYDQFRHQVAKINQRHTHTTSPTPIFDCHYQAMAHPELMQLYRQADVCWVNSLRDGMNLVAKEFIAAQDPENPGVLVLSRYAGAAMQMHQALLVDPMNKKELVHTLAQALNMPKSERIARYRKLYQGLKDFDIVCWRNQFIHDLQRAGQRYTPQPSRLRHVTGRYASVGLVKKISH